MSRNPNDISLGFSPDHFCSQLYPRGVLQSDYNVFKKCDEIKADPANDKLVEQTHASEQTSMANKLCVICYCRLADKPVDGEAKEEEKLVRLKCNHIFHQKCCTKWTKVQKVCPICRTVIADELCK